jgi:L-lactate dehydrogenase complex protein LldE
MAQKVHLFIPCFVDALYPSVGISTVNILKELGCEIIYPEKQTCCGQPAINSGYFSEAAILANNFLNIFDDAEYVVAPSGSCITMSKNLYGQLELENRENEIWQSISARFYELTDFLVNVLKIESWKGTFPAKVTYHDSCHALRELRIKNQPRKLLQSIKGLELIEMEKSETCCGFGGTFSVKFSAISTAMVQNKCKWIFESGAEIMTSTDSSCLMNINGFLERNASPVKTMHVSELLWNAFKNGQ